MNYYIFLNVPIFRYINPITVFLFYLLERQRNTLETKQKYRKQRNKGTQNNTKEKYSNSSFRPKL